MSSIEPGVEPKSELPKIDEGFDAINEGEELTRKAKLKTKSAALEALVGNPKRIGLVAASRGHTFGRDSLSFRQ